MSDINTIWLLLFIGYAFGLIIIAYFGITGTNEIIEFKNRQYKEEKNSIEEVSRGVKQQRNNEKKLWINQCI